MRKTLFIACVLLVAVISTACINSFAVQDLNNKAQAFMVTGDYEQAAEKLKSSIDLDPNIFETHYNLAVVYTNLDDYANAVEEYKKALKLKPDNADVYYSLATAENNLSVDMQQGRVRLNEQGNIYTAEAEDINFDEKYEMTEEEKKLVKELNESAVANYKKYLEMKPAADDKEAVEKLIERIENTDEEPSED